MTENNSSKLYLKQAVILGASLAAFNIGTGFSSGAELLQFMGTWGGMWPFAIIAICFITGALFCGVVYVMSYEQKFKSVNDMYYHVFGKTAGKVVDIYVYICLIGYALVMITGSGATLNQYFGWPTIVGSVGMGIVSGLIACMDFRKVTDVLGSIGIVIVIICSLVALYVLFTATTGPLEGSARVLEYVEKGELLQAGTFGIKNPVFSAFSYTGSFIMCGIPWMAAIGLVVKNKKTAIASGILSSGFLYFGALGVIYVMMVYMDHVAGAQIPMLAAMQHALPRIAGAYTIVIILGILSTVTGQLFTLSDRFSFGKTKARYGIIVGTVVFSIVGSTFIPFSRMMNVLFSFMGFVGVVVAIFIIGVYIRDKSTGRKWVTDEQPEVKPEE